MSATELLEWADAVYQFIVQWALLEASHQVDAFGGSQFRRVLDRFLLEDQPPFDAEEFINLHKLDNLNQ